MAVIIVAYLAQFVRVGLLLLIKGRGRERLQSVYWLGIVAAAVGFFWLMWWSSNR